MNAEEEAVKGAIDRFYAALGKVINGDSSAMEHVWWNDPEVTTGHPMGSWVLGWDQIWITWVEFAKAIPRGSITLLDPQIRVVGEVAYVIGTEDAALSMNGQEVAFKGQVTNILRKKGSEWRVIHHHADKAPSFEKAT